MLRADLVQLRQDAALEAGGRGADGAPGARRRCGEHAEERDERKCAHDPGGPAVHASSIGTRLRELYAGGSAAAPAGSTTAPFRWVCQSRRSTCSVPATGMAARAPRIPASSAPTSTETSTVSAESCTVRP